MNYGGKKGNNYGEIRRKASKFRSVTEPQMRRRKRPETDRITRKTFSEVLANFGEIPCGAHNFGKSADSVIKQSLSCPGS